MDLGLWTVGYLVAAAMLSLYRRPQGLRPKA